MGWCVLKYALLDAYFRTVRDYRYVQDIVDTVFFQTKK